MRSIAIIGVVLASLTSGLPMAALSEEADTVNQCEFSQSYGLTVSTEANRDLAGGYVMYVKRYVDKDYDGYGSGTMYVAECLSGSTLMVDFEKNSSLKVHSFVVEAAASDKKWTLPMLAEHFSAIGKQTQLEVQSVEHCACALFYPEAKGTKEDWQSGYSHPGGGIAGESQDQ